MADATEREREARIRVQSGMYALPERDGRLDAYRAAVRARVLADVIAVVEGHEMAHPYDLTDLLTRLRAMEGGA